MDEGGPDPPILLENAAAPARLPATRWNRRCRMTRSYHQYFQTNIFLARRYRIFREKVQLATAVPPRYRLSAN